MSLVPGRCLVHRLRLDPVECCHLSLRNHRSITIPLCSILRPIPTREDIVRLARSMVRPTVAFLINLVGTVVLIGLALFFYGTLTALYGAVVASMIYFLFIGIAAVIYALKNEKGRSKAILATSRAPDGNRISHTSPTNSSPSRQYGEETQLRTGGSWAVS